MHMRILHRRAWGSLFQSFSIRLSAGQAPKVEFKFVGVERNADVADLIAVDMPDLILERPGVPFSWAMMFGRPNDDPDILTIEDLGRFGIDCFVDCKQ